MTKKDKTKQIYQKWIDRFEKLGVKHKLIFRDDEDDESIISGGFEWIKNVDKNLEDEYINLTKLFTIEEWHYFVIAEIKIPEMRHVVSFKVKVRQNIKKCPPLFRPLRNLNENNSHHDKKIS